MKKLDAFFAFLVVSITIVIVSVPGILFFKKLKKSSIKEIPDLSEFEDRVLELVSRFQHISATRLSGLEKKISEISTLLKESNEIYLKITSVTSEAIKARIELEGLLQETVKKNVFIEKNESEDKKDIYVPEKQSEKYEKEKSEPDVIIEELKEDFDLNKSSLEHQILNLSSEGANSDEIAEKLEVGRGEVQLVLELFRRKHA